MSAYAYVCRSCGHLATQHLLIEGGELVAGPYRCVCGCEIRQDVPMRSLSREQYERFVASERAS